MARYLRSPKSEAPPPGIESRRLQVYLDLVYKNIEGFISGGFPVLRSLYSDDDWHALVRAFVVGHRCHTPYFLEISQEFIRFLQEGYQPGLADGPFLAELAHYEWVELALDVSMEQLPEGVGGQDLIAGTPRLSPLAWLLSYRYPVHKIGPAFQPTGPGEPTYLVVYRNRADKILFVELNAATARLLELVRDNDSRTGEQLLGVLANEMQVPLDSLLLFGSQQMEEFFQRSILI